VAAFTCALLHRIVHHDRFRRYHEVGYAVFLQLGVIFAVLLAFVFNGVWSDYNTASRAIDSECASLHGIAILSDRLPSPARDAILDDLRAYLTTVLDREWPDMRRRNASQAAGARFQLLWQTVERRSISPDKPRWVRRAARIGDASLIVNTGGLGKVMPLMQTYRAALKEYGRTPMEFPITVECYVGARHATAHEECRGPLEYKYAAYASWGLQDRTTQGSFEDFARDRFIIGDKGSVTEEIARYRELLGVDHFIMRCQWPGLPQKQVLNSIQRLGEIFAS